MYCESESGFASAIPLHIETLLGFAHDNPECCDLVFILYPYPLVARTVPINYGLEPVVASFHAGPTGPLNSDQPPQ